MNRQSPIAAFEARQRRVLRANAEAGTSPRYIVRCGLRADGKVSVWDALGAWECSAHKTLALAQKRAEHLNRSVSA